MTEYDAILFDLDGVLVDSEPVHFHCWNEVLKSHGIELDWDTYAANYIGISDLDMVERCVGTGGRDFAGELFRKCYPRKKELFRSAMRTELLVVPGLESLLLSLRPLKLAVVSSTDRTEVESVLESANVLSLFDALVCGNEALRQKPAPEPYIKAAMILGSRQPLVVEDSDPGEASGRAAGFEVVRVASTHDLPRILCEKLGLQLRTTLGS